MLICFIFLFTNNNKSEFHAQVSKELQYEQEIKHAWQKQFLVWGETEPNLCHFQQWGRLAVSGVPIQTAEEDGNHFHLQTGTRSAGQEPCPKGRGQETKICLGDSKSEISDWKREITECHFAQASPRNGGQAVSERPSVHNFGALPHSRRRVRYIFILRVNNNNNDFVHMFFCICVTFCAFGVKTKNG